MTIQWYSKKTIGNIEESLKQEEVLMNMRQKIFSSPSLALDLPLRKLDGSYFMSRDSYGRKATVTGALWRPDGRYFDGVDDYIELSDTFMPITGSTSKTLMARVIPIKTDYLVEGRIAVMHRTGAATAFALFALGSPATWRAGYITGGVTLAKPDSGVQLVAGQAVFLALVQDGSNIRFQVDSTVVTASDASIPTMDNPANAFIGAYSNSGTPGLFFQGTISEVYILSRALSSPEIERIRLQAR
jgi:hypothetical protein